MPSFRDVLNELVFPLRSASTLLVLGLFMLLLMLAAIAIYLNPALGVAVTMTIGIATLPALMRSFVLYITARAHGRRPEPLDADHFSWMSNRWGIFPAALFAGAGWLLFTADQSGFVWAMPVATGAVLMILPASLIVLSMTHSPLQSVHPAALSRLIFRLRASYWLAPLTAFAALGVFYASADWSLVERGGILLYCMLALCGVFGAILRTSELVDDVDLPEARVADGMPPFLVRRREDTLNLAYSFMSRDGVENGIKHIEGAIAEEEDDLSAWRWYFERMLTWENPYFACRFAQRYLKVLLADDDAVGVTKIMLRCRLLDGRFKPLGEDIPAAQLALAQAGNTELADRLTR